MKNSTLSFFPIVIIVAGCASTSTQMVNDKGQVGKCEAWGFGIIGAPAALISTQNCIEKYQAAGFREAGSPQPAGAGSPSAQIPVNNAQALPTTPTTMLSKDGSFKITLPAGWIQAPPPSPSQQLFAKNSLIDAGLLMTSVNSDDVQDWQTYAESQRVKMVGNLSQSTSSEIRKIKVNGFDALQADIGGTLKSGVKIHYLGTFIKTDKQLIQLLTWCFESRFAANRNEFESLPAGLQM